MMNEHQSCSESSPQSSPARPIRDITSPPTKHPPAWMPFGSYISTQKVVSEGSQHTSNPNSPRSSIGSFPKFFRATTSLIDSPDHSVKPRTTQLPKEADASQLFNHLVLLFCNVLPSVLLSILCIALTEAAKLLGRLANSLQASEGTELDRNGLNQSKTTESSTSSTPNFRRTLLTRTPSMSTTKSEIQNDVNGTKARGALSVNDRPDSRTGRHHRNLKHLLEELAIELTNSQTPLQAEHALARHMIATENVMLPREAFCSPPIMPSSPSMDKPQQRFQRSMSSDKKLTGPEHVETQAEKVDREDCQSSSSVVLTTKLAEDVPDSERHEFTYEPSDEAGPPDFMSPLILSLASSPTTEKAETLSRIDSPNPSPLLLSASDRLAVLQEELGDSGSDRDSVDRDSVIGARRVLSSSEKSGDDAVNSPLASKRSVSLTLQTASLIEDYDSDQMIVPIQVMKTEKDPSFEEPNYLELLRSANEFPAQPKRPSSTVECVDEKLSEQDIRCAIEPVNDDNVNYEVISTGEYEEEECPEDMSSIDREIRAYLQEKSLIEKGPQTQSIRSRPRTGSIAASTRDPQLANSFRSDEEQRSRENRHPKCIPLQNVGRSQSTAEKPSTDWPEITPFEGDKESRLSKRHLSDLSFGVRERQKDMLPKELVPDDFRSDDESSDVDEPVIERFGAKKWKRGIIAACKDVSECRKLVANLWKRRRIGTPIEEGLNSTPGIYRTDSHRSQVRRHGPHEIGVKFDSVLSQDTVFRLLSRLCSECGVSVVARKPIHKLKVTVPVPGQARPLLISIHLTRQSHTKGTTVVLARSKDDQSGAARKHIEITGLTLRQKLEENLEFIEDSFSSHLLEDSGLY